MNLLIRWTGGLFFIKLFGKNIIDTTFDYKSIYLLAEENSRIRGVLPLYHLQSLFVGNALLSHRLLFMVGFWPIALMSKTSFLMHVKSMQRAQRRVTLSYAIAMLVICLICKLEIQFIVHFKKPLAATAEENLKNLPKESRRMVRVGIKKGLVGEFNRQKINEFYNVFATLLEAPWNSSISKETFQ